MFNYELLPENLRGGMKRYIENHILPGDFLTACLENDFIEAMGHAGPPMGIDTYEYIHAVVLFLYNEMPHRGSPDCPWGNNEAVRKWVKRREISDH